MNEINLLLIDLMEREINDRMNTLPPPPPGYSYVYDFPQMTYNRETKCWDVSVDLWLEDNKSKARIRLGDFIRE